MPRPLLTHCSLLCPAVPAVQIEIMAKRNEIIDQSSLIARYQQEIQLLRGQLEIVMREREQSPSSLLCLLYMRLGSYCGGILRS